MIDFKKIIRKEEQVSVIGLGYVGFPLLIELAKKYNTVGYDISQDKIENYRNGIDVTNEVGNEATKETSAYFTADDKELQQCKFHIVAVPTPINSDKTPNLTPIIEASKTVARNLTKGSIIVYESTVYPGTTEEICIPVLEKESGLTFGEDFKVGYSPERINPGDKVNTLTKIVKVVSGSDAESLETISSVYSEIIEAGVHKAPTIKVAEASKVIENSQRDVNIAFMNELAKVFDRMDIDTNAVLEAAKTKWNFLNFQPGLVGGHCIGVDPYYFTYKAEQLGYHSQIILAGRKINDEMGKFVATNAIKQIILSGQKVKGAKIAVLGTTFKENVGDVRNTRVVDIIEELEDYGAEVVVYDPVANKEDLKLQYDIDLVEEDDLRNLSAIIIAVPHSCFKKYSVEELNNFYDKERVLIDVKGLLKKEHFIVHDYLYWSL